MPAEHNVIAMITTEEFAAACTYARKHYIGEGAIVDLGPWLGASTIAFAKGLAGHTRSCHNPVIHCYDRFIWENWMDQFATGTSMEGRFRAGDSFLGAFKAQIEPFQHLISVHPGDLLSASLFPEPIECLFIDIMKNWDLSNVVIQNFISNLIPGIATIFHQDYAHYYTPWIHLIMYRLRKYFKPLRCITYSSTVIFKYDLAVPSSLIELRQSFQSFSRDEFEGAFDYSLSITPKTMWPGILASRVMAFLHENRLDEAAVEFELLRRRFPSGGMDLDAVECRLSAKLKRLYSKLNIGQPTCE